MLMDETPEAGCRIHSNGGASENPGAIVWLPCTLTWIWKAQNSRGEKGDINYLKWVKNLVTFV